MTPAEALSRLEEVGGRIEVLPNGRAEVVLPPGPFPDEEALLAELRANRKVTLALVLGRKGAVLPFQPDPRRAVPEGATRCAACNGTDFWISLALVRICARCHPPADERLVASRERG